MIQKELAKQDSYSWLVGCKTLLFIVGAMLLVVWLADRLVFNTINHSHLLCLLIQLLLLIPFFFLLAVCGGWGGGPKTIIEWSGWD